MTLGVIILAHRDLFRAGQLARHLAHNGVRVMIHVDANSPQDQYDFLRRKSEGVAHIGFCRRVPCEWGTFSLVEAELIAAEALLEANPDVTHIALLSGACLPVRPIEELVDFLKRHGETDFIESVPARHRNWVTGGLGMERLSLWFPFSWKRRRRAFDAFVAIQRRFGISRRMPERIEPHFGSQWWCLTRRTLSRILKDPARRRYDSFFRWSWIPDESYFQTLARKHATKIENRSLTFVKFDEQGKPYTFYDDHAEMLQSSGAYFVRKVWADAGKLYARFLFRRSEQEVTGGFDIQPLAERLRKVREIRCAGRTGLLTAGSFPAGGGHAVRTSAPYTMLYAYDLVFENLREWLAASGSGMVHGHVFSPFHVGFADPDSPPGNLPDTPQGRDYRPEQFLASLVREGRGTPQCIMMGFGEHVRIERYFARDPNARIFAIKDAWLLDVLRQKGEPDRALASRAFRLQELERLSLSLAREVEHGGELRVMTLGDVLGDPMSALAPVLEGLGGMRKGTLGGSPRLVQTDGLPDLIDRLARFGVDTEELGPFPQFVERKNHIRLVSVSGL